MFITILLVSDDVGLFEAGPYRLARRAAIELKSCEINLQALADVDAVRLYRDGRRELGFVPRFRQKLKIQRAKYPLPPPSLTADDPDATEKLRVLAKIAAGEIGVAFGSKWEALRSAVIKRDGGVCLRCLTDSKLSAHHLNPKSMGGEHDATNLVTLCVSCNSWARNNEARCKEINDLALKRWPDGVPTVSVGTPEPEPEPEPEVKTKRAKETLLAQEGRLPPVAKAPATPRAKRLAPDWVLPKAWGDWAVQEMRWAPEQIRLEADKFADFWHSKAGSGATKLDWLKTWRNWCRNAKGSGGGRAPDRIDRQLEGAAIMLGNRSRMKETHDYGDIFDAEQQKLIGR